MPCARCGLHQAPAALAVAVGGTVAGFILSAIVRQNFY